MKLKDILGVQSVLDTLNQTKGLASITAYRIAKNIKTMESEIEVYDAQRKIILEELADKNEDGSPVINGNEYQVSDNNKKLLVERLNTIMDEECDITLKKVTLKDIDGAGLSPFEIANLEFMIDLGDTE